MLALSTAKELSLWFVSTSSLLKNPINFVIPTFATFAVCYWILNIRIVFIKHFNLIVFLLNLFRNCSLLCILVTEEFVTFSTIPTFLATSCFHDQYISTFFTKFYTNPLKNIIILCKINLGKPKNGTHKTAFPLMPVLSQHPLIGLSEILHKGSITGL